MYFSDFLCLNAFCIASAYKKDRDDIIREKYYVHIITCMHIAWLSRIDYAGGGRRWGSDVIYHTNVFIYTSYVTQQVYTSTDILWFHSYVIQPEIAQSLNTGILNSCIIITYMYNRQKHLSPQMVIGNASKTLGLCSQAVGCGFEGSGS